MFEIVVLPVVRVIIRWFDQKGRFWWAWPVMFYPIILT